MNKNNLGIKILAASLSLSGIILITTGAILNKKTTSNLQNKKIKVNVVQKQVAKIKSNIPILKEITLEINEPLKINIIDYIANPDDIEENILKKFKLDTSLVNVTQPGKYTYTIEYKDKKYNGIVTVKDKELPIIENLILKDLEIEQSKPLPTDIKAYVEQDIPEEAKPNIELNVSKVNTNIIGHYQYTVTYNNKIYTGNITIYEPQTTTIKEDIKLILKEVTVPVNSTLSQDVKDYISNTVKEEQLTKLKLDTSTVNAQVPGTYEYVISYDDKKFYGNIIVQ